MGRFLRKTVILLKPEATYGVDSVPAGATNAMLVSNVNINPMNASDVPRDLIRQYFGASEELVGNRFVEMSFDLELQGSGALGTAPAWGPALRACGFAEAISASQRVEYTPITDAMESASIYWYDDGLLHKALGARGTWEIDLGIGNRPTIHLSFLGLYSDPVAASNPSQTLTAWKTPLAVTDANTGDVTIGCTYATGALSGGTAYPSRGLSLTGGNKVDHNPLLGGEAIDISDRQITGKMELDLTAAQEVTFMADVNANTPRGIGMVHGQISGYKVLVFAPAAQLKHPTKSQLNGKRLIGLDLRLLPSSGNDELRIVAI